MTVSKMEIVINRGFRGGVLKNIEFYSLDAIIFVGYRVKSANLAQLHDFLLPLLMNGEVDIE